MNVSEEDFNRLQEDNTFLRKSIAELRAEIRRRDEFCMKCEHHNNQPKGDRA